MTRRDYIFLAETMRLALECDLLTANERRGVLRTVYTMADRLKANNPQFDVWMFLDNAGVGV